MLRRYLKLQTINTKADRFLGFSVGFRQDPKTTGWDWDQSFCQLSNITRLKEGLAYNAFRRIIASTYSISQQHINQHYSCHLPMRLLQCKQCMIVLVEG